MSKEIQYRVQALATTLNEVANELVSKCDYDWSHLTIEGKSVCGMMVSNAFLLVSGAPKALLVKPEMVNRIRNSCNGLAVLENDPKSFLFVINEKGEYEFEMH